MPIDSDANHESALETNFLTWKDWQASLFLPELPVEWVLDEGLIYSPGTIVSALERAKFCIDNIPGPNKEQRAGHSSSWFGFWISLMGELQRTNPSNYPFCKTKNISRPEEIGQKMYREPGELFKFNKLPAAWFVGELAGNKYHRRSFDFVCSSKTYLPVIVFEENQYMLGKERSDFILPLALRLSMWSIYMKKYYKNLGFLTVNPYSIEDGENIVTTLLATSRLLNVNAVFFNATDPEAELFGSKLFRADVGVYKFDELCIPQYVGLHTTDLVKV